MMTLNSELIDFKIPKEEKYRFDNILILCAYLRFTLPYKIPISVQSKLPSPKWNAPLNPIIWAPELKSQSIWADHCSYPFLALPSSLQQIRDNRNTSTFHNKIKYRNDLLELNIYSRIQHGTEVHAMFILVSFKIIIPNPTLNVSAFLCVLSFVFFRVIKRIYQENITFSRWFRYVKG
jgi:hypothetical protein